MELLSKYGYSLVFGAMLLEQLGFPIPATPVLIVAGALAAGGHLSLALVILFAVLASFIGDLVWFYLGRKKGRRILNILCRISLSPDSCVRKTENYFFKHGLNSLLYAKFVPGLNTIAPPMAGMFQASIGAFALRDILGAFFYASAGIFAGFLFDMIVFDITGYFEQVGRLIFWLFLGGLGAYVLVKYVRIKLLQRILYTERITPEELYRRLETGEQIVVVDLRKKFADDEDIIPGALRIPPDEIDRHLNVLRKEDWIVMYCT